MGSVSKLIVREEGKNDKVLHLKDRNSPIEKGAGRCSVQQKGDGVKSISCRANGDNSAALGLGTVANEKGQVAVGQYNAPDPDAIFMVGNGESDEQRSNAFVIKKQNGTFVVDGETVVFENEAKDISYDNTNSGLNAAVVQDAVDEVNDRVSDLADEVATIYKISEQSGVFTVTEDESTYTQRETSGGLNIVDNVPTNLKRIEGSSVSTKNLIPYPYAQTTKTVNGITFTDNGDGSISVKGTSTGKSAFKLIASGTSAVKGNYTMSFAATGTLPAEVMSVYIQPFIDETSSDAVVPNGSHTYAFDGVLTSLSIFVRDAGVTIDATFYPVLSEGVDVIPYVPYFKGLKHSGFKSIKSVGKNLVKELSAGYYTNAEFALSADTNNKYRSIKVYCAPGTYTLSTSAPILMIRSIIDGVLAKDVPNTIRSFTVTKPGYLGLSFRKDPEVAWDESITVQLERGSTATDYEPYKESIFELPEDVELGLGTAIDFEKGVVEESWEEIVLTGDTQDEQYVHYTYDLVTYPNSFVVTSVIGTKLTWQPYVATDPGEVWVGVDNYNLYWIRGFEIFGIDANSETALDDLTALIRARYAAGNPVKIRYKTTTVKKTTPLTTLGHSYTAWQNGTETINQGTYDNSEYGAENTVTQEYYTITGGA